MTLKDHHNIGMIVLRAELLHSVSHLKPKIYMHWYLINNCDVHLVDMVAAMA